MRTKMAAGSFLLAMISISGCSTSKQANMSSAENVLSAEERSNGWELLFDGTSTAGWHTYGQTTIGKAWKAENGTLRLDAASKKDWQTAEGGDIVSEKEYENFDLRLEWNIAPGGNSGIMFYVKEDASLYPYPWHTGPEMQVLDNAAHLDAKIIKHRAGDLYDLMSVSKETVKPAGEWNAVRIVANKGDLDFYMNDAHVLHTTLWTDSWRALVANSKFKDMPGFATFRSGRIALQDHGDNVWFRNIKIKRL
jgi:hypothetical protein